MKKIINIKIFNCRLLSLVVIGLSVISLLACKAKPIDDKGSFSSSIRKAKEYAQLEIDGFGNTYLLTANNVLEKYDPNHKLLFTYSFNRQGEITRIDVSNPQKILVYFQQYQNIVFLDNTLSVIKTLNLEELGYWQVNGVALSVDNFIWIYDPTLHQLIKINEEGEKVLESNELFDNNILDTKVNRILVDSRNVFVALEDQLLCYNQFGQFNKTMQFSFEEIQLFNNQLLYLKDNTIKRQGLSVEYLFDEDEIIYNEQEDIVDFKLSKSGVLFILTQSGVHSIDMK